MKKKEIKKLVSDAIGNYFEKKKNSKINYHVLQEIFPVERRVRSIIGGLETSFGETVWEPLAQKIAKDNGYTINDKNKFKRPKHMPKEMQDIIDKWASVREESDDEISLKKYVEELRKVRKKLDIDKENIEYVKLKGGQGIDLWIEKDGVEYITDIKTTQINAGDGKKFNKHILNWYAYRIFKKPDVKVRSFLSIPFNPFDTEWKEKQGKRAKPLIVGEDIITDEKFWELLSGSEKTYTKIIEAFKDLGQEGIAEEYEKIIYGKKN